jgi:hypothetical protein
MGYYFADDVQSISGDIVTTLRKVPISGGGLSRILLPGFFDTVKWRRHYQKEWGRRWYSKSKRCIMIYRLNTLTDGVYEIQSVAESTHIIEDRELITYEYIAHYFEMRDGTIHLLDNVNQVYDRLQAMRGNLEYTIHQIRAKHGYSDREIDHMLKIGTATDESAAMLRERRRQLERKYLAESTPTEKLPQGAA